MTCNDRVPGSVQEELGQWDADLANARATFSPQVYASLVGAAEVTIRGLVRRHLPLTETCVDFEALFKMLPELTALLSFRFLVTETGGRL